MGAAWPAARSCSGTRTTARRAGLVKFDLLGLGMLDALHRTVDHVASFTRSPIDLAALPQEDAVYDMLCEADTVGVFQVESRAQMATLPRIQPRCFYDLVIEVALIRPGPIQGNAVHPYIRRRRGDEPVTYLHPLLEPILERTLGVPLFQEQLMQMADRGRRLHPGRGRRTAPGHGRQALRLAHGAPEGPVLRGHGRPGGHRRRRPTRSSPALAAFANFGFPESHAVSFAYLVYSLGLAEAPLPGGLPRRRC